MQIHITRSKQVYRQWCRGARQKSMGPRNLV